MIILKSLNEIERIRSAAKAAFEIHLFLSEMIRPGIRTIDLERKALEMMERLGVTPSYKGYKGFPFAAYIDVNEEVLNALPSERRLNEGDIGVGVSKEGYHADMYRQDK